MGVVVAATAQAKSQAPSIKNQTNTNDGMAKDPNGLRWDFGMTVWGIGFWSFGFV